ncbi:MAG: DUF1838 domain-containing protein [Steroidobacteraceae bacterium]|jgi:hypothetical protein|nr:DUF1838 domain-containing protein [Steroidobacteraceae bacterium]
MDDPKFSRRTAGLMALGAAGSGALALGAGAAPALAARKSRDTLPTDPKEILESVVRIYGTTGKGRVTWKTRITVYAVQASGVVPLVGLRGSESGWWTRKDDSTWVRYSSTLSFFEDLETGKFIDEFRNPLNGHVSKVGVSFIRHKEGEYRTTMGEYYGSMRKAFPQSYPEEPIAPNWSLDDGIVRYRGRSNFPPILKQPTLETATLTVRADELFDPKVETPSATVSGFNIRPWEPWLGMGDAPGHVIWQYDGVKLTDVEKLDADYLARARAHTPLFDESPQFDEGPSFFERVIQNRGVKPAG